MAKQSWGDRFHVPIVLVSVAVIGLFVPFACVFGSFFMETGLSLNRPESEPRSEQSAEPGPCQAMLLDRMGELAANGEQESAEFAELTELLLDGECPE